MSTVTEDEVASLIPLAKAIAANKRSRLETKPPIDDLISEAMLGLTRASQKYDPSRGIPFRAFAISHINWALGQYLTSLFGYRSMGSERTSRVRPQHLEALDAVNVTRPFSYKPTMFEDVWLRERLDKLNEKHRAIIDNIAAGHTIPETIKITKASYRMYKIAINAARMALSL